MEGILQREMGSFGRFQLQTYCLIFITTILSAFSTSEYIFTVARINTRCFIPECEHSEDQTEFAPGWILNAVPAAGDSFDNCQRFSNTTAMLTIEESCPATLFNRDLVTGCDSYVYEHTNSAVYDLGLACDEWRRSLIGSVRTIGNLLSLPLTGYVSDRWGRRVALTIATFNTAWIGLLRYFATTYVGFVSSVFAESVLGAGGILSTGYILTMELAPTQYRVAIGTTSNSFFGVGQVMVGLLAWAIPYWRHFILAAYSPLFISILYIWFLPESVRWLLSKGKFEEAERTLKKIAKTNERQVSELTLLELKQAAEMSREVEKRANKNNKEDAWLVVEVFRHKPILLRCIISPVWWITLTLVYYGLSINAVNLSGNPYVNFILVSMIEIPGFWSAMLLVQIIGRKPTLIAAYWVCAFGQIAYIFMPDGHYGASITVYLISKYAIAVVVTSLYLYTLEIFPTRHRQSLFAFSSMMGRIGSIVAPLTPALAAVVWEPLPFVLFAGLALLSGVLLLLAPETRGLPLPDTMQQAADIRKHTAQSQYHKYVSRL